MDLFFRELTHLDENDEIYWKLVSLSSLLTGDQESAMREIKQGYFAHAKAFADILRIPNFVKAMSSLTMLFASGKALTRAEVLDLCKANSKQVKAEN